MEFNSLTYAIFLAAVLLLYFSSPIKRHAWRQNFLLLLCSYLFYALWDWRFLSLILLTTISSYCCALQIEHNRHRCWLTANIVLNLGLLATFKYFNFFSENIVQLMMWLGWEMDWFTVDVLLPVGISFYTFQAIGYTIDVWRGHIPACRNILTFATFIAFFPQLVAGPIERASSLMPQLSHRRSWDGREAIGAMRLILWGMFKKVAVADPCGAFVDNVYASPSHPLYIYAAALLFAVQIYCDFSGYCDIAAGSARLLGIRLSQNFNRPFISRNFIELWRRWHITLTRWFTDYLYIPLGGSRCSRWRHFANIMTVFILSGLWHGAGWGFIVWGTGCGLVYCISRTMQLPDYRNHRQPTISDIPPIFATFTIFALLFVPFRLNGHMEEAIHYTVCYNLPLAMASVLCVKLLWAAARKTRLSDKLPVPSVSLLMAAAIALFCIATLIRPQTAWFHLYLLLWPIVYLCEWATRRTHWRECPFPLPAHAATRCATYMLLYLVILTYGLFRLPPVEDATRFIYFQF